MPIAPALPTNENERLQALRSYRILDSSPEADYDELARLASFICDTPVALVTLVDARRQWFKANIGLPGVEETPREISFCGHTILAEDLLVVPDARLDPRFADNPLVTGKEGSFSIRFYAGAPLINPEGNALGSICVIDRAPRQLTPEQIEALRALSRQVVKLLELRRTGTRLEKALEAKSEFLRIASHDLKNPLAVILASASFLHSQHLSKTASDSEDFGRILESIVRQAGHMRKLVEDYLDAQALEDEALVLDVAPRELQSLLRGVIQDLENYARSKETAVLLESPKDQVWVPCDEARLGQVITNLIGNAIKFSPRGSQIQVKAYAPSATLPPSLSESEETPQDRRFAIVEIFDAGPGIDVAEAQQLFRRFGRGTAQPTGGEKSTGLGLTICKRLVELHGGRIGVYNADSGAVFWFALPLPE